MLRHMAAAARPLRGLHPPRGGYSLWARSQPLGVGCAHRSLGGLWRGMAQAAGDAGPSEESKAAGDGSPEPKEPAEKDAAGKEAGPAAAAPSQGELLRQELAQLQDKVKAKKHELLLSLAEFENTKKRFTKEREVRRRGTTVHFAKKIIDAYIEFDTLTGRVDASSDELSPPCQSFHEGIVLTRDLYRTTLGRFGVEQFAAERGHPFLSTRHESVGTVSDESLAANTIAEQVQPGWVLEPGATLLKRAQVKVVGAPGA